MDVGGCVCVFGILSFLFLQHTYPPSHCPFSYAVSVDYTASSQILNLCIPAGSTSVSFTISVVDDDISEDDEMLTATIIILASVANQSIFLGTPGVHTLTIRDDDEESPSTCVSSTLCEEVSSFNLDLPSCCRCGDLPRCHLVQCS